MDAQGWRPIETAPRDKAPILAVTEEGITVIEWDGRWWLAVPGTFASDSSVEYPAHWMPLPAPPQAEAGS